jgi:AraC-like DNA-binding protein
MTARDNQVTAAAIKRGSAASEPDHASRELRGIFGALERLGYDLDPLLAAAGIRRADVDDPNVNIPASVCAGLVTLAQQQRRLTNLASRLALETPIGVNPLLDYLILSSESLGEGLQRLARYIRVVNPFLAIRIHDRDDPPRMVVDSASPFWIEFTVALSIFRFRRETGNELASSFVSLRHQPDDVADLVELLRCPVRTGAAWTGWALTREALRLPLRRRDPVLHSWLENKAREILAQHPPGSALVSDVRQLLTAQMAAGMRIDVVARSLAMTPRTLQRKLKDEGTSFDALRDATRRHAAEALLSDSTLSIGEVTYLLGYSEPTAFHRAFRRWHRLTPQEFRQQRRQQH